MAFLHKAKGKTKRLPTSDESIELSEIGAFTSHQLVQVPCQVISASNRIVLVGIYFVAFTGMDGGHSRGHFSGALSEK